MNYSKAQLNMLVVLRVIVGWHFAYEGLVKVLNPNWSSIGFLMDSGGIFAGLFKTIASNPGALAVADFLNMWGLVAIGLGLMLGCLTRIALPAGMLLLAFYYLSHPPFIGLKYAMPTEGSYWLVNKNLIELFAMAVLYVFPTSKIIGFDRFLFRKKA